MKKFEKNLKCIISFDYFGILVFSLFIFRDVFCKICWLCKEIFFK